MKFLTFILLILLSFSIYANCDAPVELWLESDIEQPGKVVLEYSHDVIGDVSEPYGLIYRARKSSGEWVDIHEFEIINIPDTDKYFIASEECVPPGEWTYIIPFDCYEYACNCSNFNSITVKEYSSECVNSSKDSEITSEEFQQMQKDESWYDDGNDDSEFSDEEEPEDEVFDETETTDEEEIPDELQDEIIIDSADETSDETIVDEDKADNEISTDNDLDVEVQDVENVAKSDGCSIVAVN